MREHPNLKGTEVIIGIPKLFVHAVPGAILGNPQMLEYVRTFKNQREVTVYGSHYVQEVSGAAIGRALAEWIPTLTTR